MSDLISRFEKSIQRINLIYGLFWPVAISVFLSGALWIIRPTYFQSGDLARQTYFIVTGIVAIVVMLQGLARKRISEVRLASIYIGYHVALALLSIFVVPYPSPFAFMWIILMVAVDLLFGKKWQRVTIAYFGIVHMLAFLHSPTTLTVEHAIVAIVYISGAAIVGIQVSKYRQVSDDERSLLGKESRLSAFERQRLLSLINNMGEAVVATDQAGKILLYNAAVLDLLDTNMSLDNKSLASVLNLHNNKGHKVNVLNLLLENPHGLLTTDYTHQYEPHDQINIYLNIAPIKLGFKEKSDSGFIIMMRDVTKEKSLEEERDEFISVISHELRTPVAIAEGNISNALFVTKKTKSSEILEKALTQAHDQVIFLASMINDLATLSRAERTDVALELSRLDPRELIHALEHDYQTDADLKGLKLTASAAADTAPITTSELYLHEILQNFITNAIKYTKKGSIIIHVRSDKEGNAVFSVADTGIGLSKADQKRVFDKFFRSEDYRTRESSGTGLGLYVTAKLAHRLNATIGLESTLDKGTTFTITVPSIEGKKRLTKPKT